MRNAVFGSVLAAIAIGCLLIATRGTADQEKANANSGSPFKGQVVAISSKASPEMGAVLQDIRVMRLGERSFLVGTGVDDGHPENWYKGRTVWVAIDDAALIVEFGDTEQYRKAGARVERETD